MFDSLDERMKLDDSVENSSRERWVKYTMVTLLSVLMFGGLYLGLMLLEG
ncbi:MAG: hypothetical protein GY953_26120 [bacterium]|nr:hypothetical protein [bacterium]